MLLSFITAPSQFGVMPSWAPETLVLSMVILAFLFFVQWDEVDRQAVRKRLLIGALIAVVVAVILSADIAAFVYVPGCEELVPWSYEWWMKGCFFLG